MSQIRNLAILFLVLGVIMAEFLPNINPATNLTAYSQINALPNQSEILLSFLDSAEKETNNPILTQSTTVSLDSLGNTPTNLIELIADINSVLSPTPSFVIPSAVEESQDYSTILPLMPPPITNQPTLSPIPEIDKPFIRNIIPPNNTPLFEAYLRGGRAWYEEDNKVVVKWPNKEIFKSFNKTTGEEINWLQDSLSYEPLDSPNALDNYINNYHGEIAAETKTWALVKFPSGGFIKISKSAALTIPFLTQE